MACKTNLFLLKKKDVVSNGSYLNLRRHNFDFHLSNTVVAVDLFVAVAVADVADGAIVNPVVVAVGKDIQE